jgi:hypothetical protein
MLALAGGTEILNDKFIKLADNRLLQHPLGVDVDLIIHFPYAEP